jgi:hypothetical protein
MNGTSQPVGAPPPGAPGAPPAKKGMGPLAWIGIGCVVIIILCGIAFSIMGWMAKRAIDKYGKNPGMAAAVLMVKANPDLELVSTDEKANSIVVKNKKTGETMTMTADANGKFSFKNDKGETATFDASGENGVSIKSTDEKGQVSTFNAGGPGAPQNLPSWLPTYPGGTISGTYDTNNDQERTAAFTVTTKDDPAKVIDYYDSQFKGAGLTTEKNNYDANGQKGGTVTGKSADEKRQASVLVSTSSEGTQAVVSFTEKKQ